jgi:ABC-type transport system substrate-binding protein
MAHLKVSRRTMRQGIVAADALLTWRKPDQAMAQSRAESLVAIGESGPNSLDIHGVGANRPSYAMAWNCYDRLLTFGKKTLPDGTMSYDKDVLAPELAEKWEVAADVGHSNQRRAGAPTTPQARWWAGQSYRSCPTHVPLLRPLPASDRSLSHPNAAPDTRV